jgi:hypothetical protein
LCMCRLRIFDVGLPHSCRSSDVVTGGRVHHYAAARLCRRLPSGINGGLDALQQHYTIPGALQSKPCG